MSKKVTGKIGQYEVPTYKDYDNFWYYLNLGDESEEDESDFVLQVCLLCKQYAEKLVEYEKRYEDDGK